MEHRLERDPFFRVFGGSIDFLKRIKLNMPE